MSVLSGKTVYLSGPIEFGNDKFNWRIIPKQILKERFGLSIFDPFDDPKQQFANDLKEARIACNYELMAKIAKGFVKKDLSIVDRCDILIAHLPYQVPTVGTHHEVINASNAKKPTLLVCPQGKNFIPCWYYGFIPHKRMFGGWNYLYDYLQEVEDKKHLDDDRWSFIYGLI